MILFVGLVTFYPSIDRSRYAISALRHRFFTFPSSSQLTARAPKRDVTTHCVLTFLNASLSKEQRSFISLLCK